MKKGLPADFSEKVRRGMEARVRRGSSWGSMPYGYYALPEQQHHLRIHGRAQSINQSINASEAAVVVRIFELFAGGKSPRTIAQELNTEGIPWKDGRIWTESTVRGHSQRGYGVLRNEIYIGRLIWNRQRFARDTSTGREVGRPNPKNHWVVVDVPELRVVPQGLWDKVQVRLHSMSNAPAAQRGRKQGVGIKGPPRHLFDGLVKCASCGGDLILNTRHKLSCMAARKGGSCRDQREISCFLLEEVVTQVVKNRLATRGLTHQLIRDFCASLKRFQRHATLQKGAIEHELRSTAIQLASLNKIFDVGLGNQERQRRAAELAQRKHELEARLIDVRALTSKLQPSVAKEFRQTVRSLGETLNGRTTNHKTGEILRRLIDKIIVRPHENLLAIELSGDIANVLSPLENIAVREKHPKHPVTIVSGIWFQTPLENLG